MAKMRGIITTNTRLHSGLRVCRTLRRSVETLRLALPGGRVLRVQWTPGKGLWASAILRNRLPGADAIYTWSRPDWTMKKKKAANAESSGQRHLAPLETDVFKAVMAIVEHLAIRQYDDGDPREPGTLLLSTLGAAWRITAKDPDSCMQLPVVANTLDDALVLLDTLLRAEEAPWEPDQWALRRKAEKKKK